MDAIDERPNLQEFELRMILSLKVTVASEMKTSLAFFGLVRKTHF